MYKVLIEGFAEESIESMFPSLAAREVAERLRIVGDKKCVVMDDTDDSITQWKVSSLATWYVRPWDEEPKA